MENYLWFSCVLIPVWVWFIFQLYWENVMDNAPQGLGGIGLGVVGLIYLTIVGVGTIIGMIIYGYFVRSAIKGNYLGSLRGMAWFISIPNSILLFLFIRFLFFIPHEIQGCSYKKNVIHIFNNNYEGNSPRRVDGAYVWNFECEGGLGKTDELVFYSMWNLVKIVSDANPETIERVASSDKNAGRSDVYLKDDVSVFYSPDLSTAEFYKVKNVNPEKFRYHSERFYYTDDNNIFYEGSFINNVDLDSFKGISNIYSKDKNYVYYKGIAIIEGADPDSFEVVEDYFTKDKYNIYYDGSREIESVHSELIDLLGVDEYEKYKKNIYSLDNKLRYLN